MVHAKSKKIRFVLVFLVVLSNAIAVKHPNYQIVGGVVDAIALLFSDF